MNCLEFQELKQWLVDRMHLRNPAAADIDRRTDEAPYDKPLSEWNGGGGSFRSAFARCIRQILGEAQSAPWAAAPLHNLLTLVEEGNIEEMADILSDIVHSEAWFGQEDGSRLHMLALRTLLGLGRGETPEFWMSENNRLEGRYPRLIFRGLLFHGLEQAFDRLPQVANDVQSAEKITRLFPRLIEEQGMERIRDLVNEILSEVGPEVREYLSEWFPNWDYGPALQEDKYRQR